MLTSLLWLLRRNGVDIKSPHRRDATSAMAVQRRLLAGKDVRVVFDCGAHHGRIAGLYHRMFPGAKVYCFEPTPGPFRVLSAAYEGNDRVEAINAAVADRAGEMDFYTLDDEQSNSLAKVADDAKVIKVRVVSLGDFCAERGIDSMDVLKMDVEGYELRILQGLDHMLRAQKIDVVYCEVRFEPPTPDCTHFVELAAYLRERGYRFMGFYDTLYTPTLRYNYGDVIFASDACLERIGGRDF